MAGCRSLRSRNRKIACKLCIVSFFSCPVCFDGLSRVLVFPPVSSLDIVPLVLPLSPSFPSALALSPPSFSLFPSSSPPVPCSSTRLALCTFALLTVKQDETLDAASIFITNQREAAFSFVLASHVVAHTSKLTTAGSSQLIGRLGILLAPKVPHKRRTSIRTAGFFLVRVREKATKIGKDFPPLFVSAAAIYEGLTRHWLVSPLPP